MNTFISPRLVLCIDKNRQVLQCYSTN